jgi:hypothetical protein
LFRYFVVWLSYNAKGRCVLQHDEVRRGHRLEALADVERLEEDLRTAFHHGEGHVLVLNWILLGQERLP